MIAFKISDKASINDKWNIENLKLKQKRFFNV